MSEGASSTMAAEDSPLIAIGSCVILVVSSGPDDGAAGTRVPAPRVQGMMQGKALKNLKAQGILPQLFHDHSETHVAGRVMGQLPPAGSPIAKGAAVTLLISSGAAVRVPGMVRLPDVVGMPEAEGTAAVRTGGLSPEVTYASSATVPKGVVVAQLPDSAWLEANPIRKTNWWGWVVAGAVLLILGVLAALLLGA